MRITKEQITHAKTAISDVAEVLDYLMVRYGPNIDDNKYYDAIDDIFYFIDAVEKFVKGE